MMNSPSPLPELPLCGANSLFPASRVGCGLQIESVKELYRCAQCHTPFHHQCIMGHFGSHEQPAMLSDALRVAKAEATLRLVEAERERLREALERSRASAGKAWGYVLEGVLLDIEGAEPELREAYIDFLKPTLRKLAAALAQREGK